MKRSVFFSLILLCCAVFAANANWIPLGEGTIGAEPVVSIIESDSNHTVFSVDFPGLYVEPVKEGESVYHKITVPDSGHTQEVGAPGLPRVVFEIAVPDSQHVAIREISRDTVALENILPLPVQEPLTDIDKPGPFQINSKLYQTGKSFPVETIRVSDPAIWRDVRLVHATLLPVSCEPVKQTVEASKKLVFELIYTDADSVNIKKRNRAGVSPVMDSMYRSALLNYDAWRQPLESNRDSLVQYLIIADDTLVTPVAPLADWYNRTGIVTEIMPMSTISGGSATDVKAVLQDYYDNQMLEYVLLVGESTVIPLGNTSGDPGDYTYQLLEGGDDIADVACGRIITTEPDIVSHVIARTFNYIQNPPADGWLDKSMLCAHGENYPDKYTACKEEIRTYSYALNTMIFDTYYPPEGATHAQVEAAMTEGRGIVNYRGHGDNTYWTWAPDWDVDHVHALANGAHTPIVWNIACYNGNITTAGECLSEAWQNAGASGEGGAVANIGATEPSYTVANHAFDKMLYRAPLDEGIFRWGYVVDRGKEYMIAEEGQYGIDNSYMYMCFGDPAFDMHTMTPITMDVSHLPTAPIGGSDFTVTVTDGSAPIENALVCIMKSEDELYEVGYTDAMGVATLPAILTSGGFMQLTITAHNALPYMTEIIVEAAGCGAILLDRGFYNCSQEILIRVWDSDLNLNPGVADTTVIEIVSDSEPTPEMVTLTETGPDTEEFAGTVMTSDTQGGPGYLLLAHDDAIEVTYHDDDCEGSPRDVTDTAVADCQGPVISEFSVDYIGIDSAIISWVTSEPADTRLFYGETTPPGMEVYDDRYQTEHVVTLEELGVCTDYVFYVTSTDIGGNETINDNGGAYFAFTTLQLHVLLTADMNTDPGWSYDGQWAWGIPQGNEGDPTAGQTGDNVVGYNLAGAYGNSMSEEYATSLPFDCSSATETYLSFYKWLGVESASYDHATVEISADGGTTWETVWDHTGGTVTGGAWEYVEYDVSSWAAGSSNVLLRWSMGPSDGSVVECGWNIDDVMVSYTAPCNVPILVYNSHTIDDSSGNNDGIINAGETISMALTIENVGLSATGITAEVTTTNGDVTITQGSLTFADIPQSGTAEANEAIVFEVSEAIEDGDVIPLNVAWVSAENTGSFTFSELAAAPMLNITGYEMVEISGGEFDGIWEPGETIQIMVTVMNTGNGGAYDVQGVLSSDLPAYVTLDDETALWPDIAGGETATCLTPYFQVTADSSIPDPSTVSFTVDFTGEGFTSQGMFLIDCTMSNFARRFFFPMDCDPGWAIEEMWEWGIPQGNEGDPSSGYTGDYVYGYNLAGDYTNDMAETYLTSDPMDCTGFADVEVRFMRWLGVESASYDHASFRVSNDGTTWNTIYDHTGSSFTDPDWQAMVYDISQYADNQPTVYLQWVMGTTDGSVTYCGWNLDDIEIWADGASMPPTATPAECINDGDVTLDGELTAGDAQMGFQIALMMITPTYEEECAADCNGDAEVTAGDAQAIFIAALGSGSCADPMAPELDVVHTALKAIDESLQNVNRNVSTNIIDKGDVIFVDVVVTESNDISAFTLTLAVDPELQLVDCFTGDLDPGWIDFGCNEMKPGVIRLGAYSLDTNDIITAGSNGTIATLELRPAGGLETTIDRPHVRIIQVQDDLK